MEKKDISEITPKGNEPDVSEIDDGGDIGTTPENHNNDIEEQRNPIMEQPNLRINDSDDDGNDDDIDEMSDEEIKYPDQEKAHGFIPSDLPHLNNPTSLLTGHELKTHAMKKDLNSKFLKSMMPKRKSERLRAPIYNMEELEEEYDLNKRMGFGLNNLRNNIFLYCYRCK